MGKRAFPAVVNRHGDEQARREANGPNGTDSQHERLRPRMLAEVGLCKAAALYLHIGDRPTDAAGAIRLIRLEIALVKNWWGHPKSKASAILRAGQYRPPSLMVLLDNTFVPVGVRASEWGPKNASKVN